MASLSHLVMVLKKECGELERQLSGLNAALVALSGTNGTRKRGKMSVEARGRIAAAQRKRWAAVKAAKKKSA